jgi:thioredoxin 1
MSAYTENAPTREEVDAFKGATVIQFGTDWCGYCMAAEPHIVEAMAKHPQLRHLKIEDGPGRPLGRSFRVKLWPTLIFMKDGAEIARVVRPRVSSATRSISSPDLQLQRIELLVDLLHPDLDALTLQHAHAGRGLVTCLGRGPETGTGLIDLLHGRVLHFR